MVEVATVRDLDAVMQLLDGARAWHLEQGVPQWNPFDRREVAADIGRGRVFLAKEGATATLYDHDIGAWGAGHCEAIYVHRLASRKPGLGAALLQWAGGFARERGKRCLRLETWDGNPRLRAYYERQGFRLVRNQTFASDAPLPADYRGTTKGLYQLDL